MADKPEQRGWTNDEVKREEAAERARVRLDAARGVTKNLQNAVAHTGVCEAVRRGVRACAEAMTEALNPEPLLRALH
jgi:hypothetical protein